MSRLLGRSLLTAAVASLATACATASPQVQADLREVSAPAVLRPGDALRVTVWRKADLSGEFPIAEDGTIEHPLLRDVKVAGLSAPDAEERVRVSLERLETSPQFVVQPLLRVMVGGEVSKPTLYHLPPATSIAEAVALAGGASPDRGRLDRVRVFRDGREFRVDLTRPEAGAAHSPVRSGDQIFVDRKRTVLRDYVAPAASVAGVLLTTVNIMIRIRR
jgi:polysaccharide export outer membrane protein